MIRLIVKLIVSTILLSVINYPILADYVPSNYEINERPLYGRLDLPDGKYDSETEEKMVAADEEFKKTLLKAMGSYEAASMEAVKRGYKQLENNDFSKAMIRFNQAWLLMPDNYHAWWGISTVLLNRDHDPKKALFYIEKARELHPNKQQLSFVKLTSNTGHIHAILKETSRSNELFLEARRLIKDDIDLTIEKEKILAKSVYAGLIYCAIVASNQQQTKKWIKEAIDLNLLKDNSVKAQKALIQSVFGTSLTLPVNS